MTVNNKPWKNESYHDSFEAADAIRQKLLRIWKDNPKHEGMQVKVKWMESKSKFAVKTRLHPDFEAKKEEKKKDGKSRKRNKKNTGGRMFDPTASV